MHPFHLDPRVYIHVLPPPKKSPPSIYFIFESSNHIRAVQSAADVDIPQALPHVYSHLVPFNLCIR